MHISKGKPTKNSTKVWLTKAGGCIVANNSNIPKNELNDLLDIVSLYYFEIVAKWKLMYGVDDVRFYC